ncbi:hypothetical protein ACSTLD_23535, partial [Vibrio parahaemolyticus]
DVQGKVEINNFRRGLWSFDKVELNGSYGGGLVEVDKLRLEVNGGRASLRNKLEIAVPFKPEAAVFQLHLENARFEDF